MIPTRETWGIFALVGTLAVLTVVLAQPVLLAGVVGVSAWIISRHIQFLRMATALDRSITVEQRLDTSTIQTDEETSVTLAVDVEAEIQATIDVETGIPVAASNSDHSVTLSPKMTEAQLTKHVQWPVAGRHTFRPAQITVTDGIFQTQFTAGSTPTITVEPPTPQAIHVGRGGDRVANVYGNHDAGTMGSGITPAEIREYLPNDPVRNIDWKTTARFNTPHVREYDAETDRVTFLVVDRSPSLITGDPGDRKFEHLREIALAVTGSAREFNDPLGLCLINPDHGSEILRPSSTVAHYDEVRRQLLESDPEIPNTPTPHQPRSQLAHSNGDRSVAMKQSQMARTRSRNRLATDNETSSFTQTLRPFYETSMDQVVSLSLPGTVHRILADLDSYAVTVIFTDDQNPQAVSEAVRTAREQGSIVLVFLTPTVLFEPGGLTDLEEAYQRYVAFENQRQTLDSIEGVTAFEVAPESRLAAVLESATKHRQGETA